MVGSWLVSLGCGFVVFLTLLSLPTSMTGSPAERDKIPGCCRKLGSSVDLSYRWAWGLEIGKVIVSLHALYCLLRALGWKSTVYQVYSSYMTSITHEFISSFNTPRNITFPPVFHRTSHPPTRLRTHPSRVVTRRSTLGTDYHQPTPVQISSSNQPNPVPTVRFMEPNDRLSIQHSLFPGPDAGKLNDGYGCYQQRRTGTFSRSGYRTKLPGLYGIFFF